MSTHDQSPLNKARIDKFRMVLNLPEAIRGIDSSASRTESKLNFKSLQYSIWGTVVPEVAVPHVEARYSGQTLKVSSHARPVYDNIKVNFTVDNRFNNYWTIYKWLDIMNDDRDSTYDTQNITETLKDSNPIRVLPRYSADFSIYAIDEYDNNVAEFVYTQGFPVKLGDIQFSNRQEDEIESTVEFAYSQMIMKLVDV